MSFLAARRPAGPRRWLIETRRDPPILAASARAVKQRTRGSSSAPRPRHPIRLSNEPRRAVRRRIPMGKRPAPK
jgi:hypothetical protein